MNNEQTAAARVLLSRDELRAILRILDADFIPGLDSDPLGSLSAEQDALSVEVAGRGLRARGLARIREDGQWVVRDAVLRAVGACAYSQSAVFIYHWPAEGDIPIRLFGHILKETVVAHTRPEDVLHLFSVLPSREALIDEVLGMCQLEEGLEDMGYQSTVPGQAFAALRELSSAGQTADAVRALTETAVPQEIAQALAELLAASPRISVIHTLKQRGKEAVDTQDFTVLQCPGKAWLVAPLGPASSPESLLVKSTTREEVRTRLLDWV